MTRQHLDAALVALRALRSTKSDLIEVRGYALPNELAALDHIDNAITEVKKAQRDFAATSHPVATGQLDDPVSRAIAQLVKEGYLPDRA